MNLNFQNVQFGAVYKVVGKERFLPDKLMQMRELTGDNGFVSGISEYGFAWLAEPNITSDDPQTEKIDYLITNGGGEQDLRAIDTHPEGFTRSTVQEVIEKAQSEDRVIDVDLSQALSAR